MTDQPDSSAIEPARPEQSEAADSTPLDHVIDDLEPKLAWAEWAVEEMTKGRSADELTVELADNGWGGEDAAELVESARRRTRHLRGVITRDEVARANAARYHKSTAMNWFSVFRCVSTTFVSVSSARNLLHSLAFLLKSNRRQPPPAPGFPVEPATTVRPEPRSDTSTVDSDELTR